MIDLCQPYTSRTIERIVVGEEIIWQIGREQRKEKKRGRRERKKLANESLCFV